METTIRQAAGIDCGSQELVVSFGFLSSAGNFSLTGTKAFANTARGFIQLLHWADDRASKDVAVLYVMEATGVYHEKLAYHLAANDRRVSIVLPNKINAFAKTCASKKQDDRQASRVLAEFGCVKKVDEWQPPHPVLASLKQLSREKSGLQQEQTVVQNQLHAEETKALTSSSGVKRRKARIRLIEKQIAEIEREMADLVKEDASIKEKINHLCTIPGVGLQTALTVVAETNGFYLIRNSRQLVSYAGLDVVQKESGTSVRGRAHISKRGNPHLRRCLHFPALVAVRHTPSLCSSYITLYRGRKRRR